MDLISIIIPVYKVEKYIHRCVDSVINQTYKNLEIILVDDGSPDNCGKICDEYAQKDNRIKVIHKENGGLSDARNYGIDAATGEWLFFIDSDDWMHPQTIEVLYKAVVENSVAVSACCYSETYGEESVVDVSVKAELWTPKDLYMKRHITSTIACAKLYKKDCFKNIRYPVGKIHEDEFVTYRILFAQEKIAFIDQPYYFYFFNDEGIMKSSWKPQHLAIIEALEEQVLFFETIRDNELMHYAEQLLFWFLVSEHQKAITAGYDKEIKKIRNKTVWLTIQSPRKLFSEQNIWVLENFFPRFMRCYWGVKAVFNKISGKSSR